MTITIVARFESPTAAGAAAQDLADAGFCRDEMSIASPDDTTTLTVRCADDEDERACAVIERHRPTEMRTRGMTSTRSDPPR